MPYSKVSDFSADTRLVAGTFNDNADAARVYLHQGIVGGDLAASGWVDTRHLAGVPEQTLLSGVHHGMSGHAGGQNGAALLSRFTFITQATNGPRSAPWGRIPLCSVRLALRRPADVFFSYWLEAIAGPDDRSYAVGAMGDGIRTTWVKHYVGDVDYAGSPGSQIIHNNVSDFDNTSPYRTQPDKPYEINGWGDVEGTRVTLKASDGYIGNHTIGLAAFSHLTRTAVLNWGFCVEAYY